jgi:predicted PurR-regulated permease PerM
MGFAGVVTNLLVVLFAGMFIAIEPARARDGLLMLLPKGPRGPTGEALDASGRALKLWLLGVLADMAAVGVMTGVGAWIVGLPSPLALGVIAAITDFVPFVGPIAGAIPGVLLALPEGPSTVGWTLLMYLVVQQVEGNLLYPFLQRRAVDLPPALSLAAVLAFGVLFGPAGVILATPLLVVVYTMVRMLYVRGALGEEIEVVPGGKKASG